MFICVTYTLRKLCRAIAPRRLALFWTVFRPLAYRNLRLWPTTRPNASGSRVALTVLLVLPANFFMEYLTQTTCSITMSVALWHFYSCWLHEIRTKPKTGSRCHCHPLNACSSWRVHSSIALRLLLWLWRQFFLTQTKKAELTFSVHLKSHSFIWIHRR